MHKREVVITGMGLITPLGRTTAENQINLEGMKTGISHYPKPDAPLFLQFLGKVGDVKIPPDLPQKLLGQMKFLNRGATMGFLAAREALTLSGGPPAAVSSDRRGIYIASGDFTKAGYDFMYPAMKDATDGRWREIDTEKLNASTLNKVNPFFLLESLSNNLISFLSAYLECMGPNTSLASLSPCGGYAVELAYRSIVHNKADWAMAVGCGNWITEVPLYEIESLGIVSKCRNGIRSFRPLDKNRDGFITGEGGAALLLEAADIAQQRGAPIFGKIRGLGNCIEFSSRKGFTVPEIVTKRCMETALRDAGSRADDLACIIPHGSGTQKGDRSELRSIADLLGQKRSEVPMTGMKAYTGHLGAASDIAEIIFGVLSLKRNIVPATLNFSETDREFSDLRISSLHQLCGRDLFLSASYGVGGQSSSVVVEVL